MARRARRTVARLASSSVRRGSLVIRYTPRPQKRKLMAAVRLE